MPASISRATAIDATQQMGTYQESNLTLFRAGPADLSGNKRLYISGLGEAFNLV